MKLHQAALPTRTSVVLATVLFLALVGLTAGAANGERLIARIVWAGMIAVMAGRVFVTGRISRWRSVFFIILAWAFIVQFKATLIGLTGSAFITPDIQEVPYCHIAIASSFLNHLYQQYLAFMSGAWRQWSPLTWGVVWLGVTLVLGQAWCSWACFYGGLDNGFALLRRKPLVKWVWLPKGVRDLPAAILIAMLLVSLVTLKPIFCLWVCPLKLGTGFLEPDQLTRKLQLLSFATIGIVFLVVLPWLTKKRAFCGLICPFGAWQAFVGRLNPYRVQIQPDRCTQCQRCIVVCPTFAIEREGLKQHRVLPYCNRCGECMDACPTDAIGYSLVGKPFASLPPKTARIAFLLSAWLIGGAVSMWFVPEVMVKLWRWVAG
ncbi:MAG TPA: hypothetical protein DCP69_07770 [Candidatus Omnitrophica bacterium]|nr:hypothetical protein [Candidatus Omnitrophota bacterium]